MHESGADLIALQELLDRSYASAGPHLLRIHTPERRLTATQLSERLTGMRLLSLATVTADGRPVIGPVDGIFYRGAFYFGSGSQSVRIRHIRARPQVSATHLPGEELGVTVHGRAVPIDIGAAAHRDFRGVLLDIYVPRYGPEWERFLEAGLGDGPPVYARIDAERMFAFHMPTAQEPQVAEAMRKEPQVSEALSEEPEFAQALREEDVDPDPFRQFSAWFDEARASGVRLPEAAALATANRGGIPSVRMVLVKETGTPGFVFYSNFESRKGEELAANPRAALLFYWDPLGRQVRIEGEVDRLREEQSAAYVRTRPRASQLSALASPQSQVVPSREWLEQQVAELTAEHQGAELPLPGVWGGFRLAPQSFEFWQHREDRLHDRLRYTRADGAGWRLERLAP